MYKCKECGQVFGECEVITERHNLDTPPFEKMSVCPHCKKNNYISLIRNEFSRTEAIEQCAEALMYMNIFAKKVNGILSEKCLVDFDSAYTAIYELLNYAAVGKSNLCLPANFDEIVEKTVDTSSKAFIVSVASENIERGKAQ